jgi:poly(3-hydroxybutyrate) depolymerase
MKRLAAALLFIFASIMATIGQICNSPRFTETLVYPGSDIFIDSNVIYGHAINWVGADETLSLNMAFPKLAIDTMQKRPLVFLIHGGGFVGGDKTNLNGEAYLFARRGFVAVTIDYRLGRDCSGPDTLSYDKAVYRAVQDANAALRFMVSKADSLRIDTNWIFIGGGSAGAGTCLAMTYASQNEFNASNPALQSVLGNLNNSTNGLTNTFTVKGIFNNWGGVARDFFEPSEALPTINFHGDADPTVDVDSALGNSCVNPPYVYGSNLIHQKLTQWGVCSQTVIKIGGGHGIYLSSTAATDFRIGKASCFFKSIMCDVCFSDYTTDSIPATCSTTLSLDNESLQEFSLYPNPVQTTLFVKPLLQDKFVDLFIYDLNGKIKQISFGKNEISVAGLSNGIYVLQVRDGEKIQSYKFVKN